MALWNMFYFIFYQILFSINFLDSILIVLLNINNQKHLKLIYLLKKILIYYYY